MHYFLFVTERWAQQSMFYFLHKSYPNLQIQIVSAQPIVLMQEATEEEYPTYNNLVGVQKEIFDNIPPVRVQNSQL